MDVLLITTGFTGALTLVYLVRLVLKFFYTPLAVTAHFSPSGGCTDVIVREINAARREVLVLAYGFTSRPIAQALVDAKFRGVHVEVILDHSNEKDANSEMHFLLEQKLVPLIDAQHAIAHNKVMLVDGKTLLTGSFNFTQHAESHNAENLVVLKGCPDLVASYHHDFTHHKAHARAVETAGVQAAHEDHRHAHPPASDKHDILDAVARGTVATQNEDEPAKEGNGPVTTIAATEMFARLRKENHGEHDHSTRKAA